MEEYKKMIHCCQLYTILMFSVQMAAAAEPILAQQVQNTIKRCGLPLELDTLTEADGNCWVRAVDQQVQRKELRFQLNTRTKEALGARGAKYLNLKKKIADFATSSKHPTVLALKEEFETKGQGVIDKVSWDDHWETLQKDTEWSDEVMVQMTAYFLGHDIQLVLKTGLPEAPFKTVHGNLD